MKRTAILLLLAATPLLAADSSEWHASVMRVRSGFSASLAFTPRAAWDVEAGVSEQSFDGAMTVIIPPPFPSAGAPAAPLAHYTVRPIDLFVTRHFDTGARLSPYVRAGARYVGAPKAALVTLSAVPVDPLPAQPVTFGFDFAARTSAQAGAGALFRLTPRTALRAEATRLLRSEGVQFDPLTRYAAGLTWRF